MGLTSWRDIATPKTEDRAGVRSRSCCLRRLASRRSFWRTQLVCSRPPLRSCAASSCRSPGPRRGRGVAPWAISVGHIADIFAIAAGCADPGDDPDLCRNLSNAIQSGGPIDYLKLRRSGGVPVTERTATSIVVGRGDHFAQHPRHFWGSCRHARRPGCRHPRAKDEGRLGVAKRQRCHLAHPIDNRKNPPARRAL